MSTAAAAPLPVRPASSDQERVVVADTCVVLTVTIDGKPIIVRVCPPGTPPFPPM
jgi:hypothetical protein